MTGQTAALVLALVLAGLIVAAWGRPTVRKVGGLFVRDRKGRMTLILTPTPKNKKRRNKP